MITATDPLKVGLLVPTLNAGKKWHEALQAISAQTIEIHRKLIIDSGSSDNTVEDAASNGFDIFRINKYEFGHGKTRQRLLDLASDVDICIFLTQDAILVNPYSLANLANAFKDPRIGVAYGRQLPHKKAKTLGKHARLYNYPVTSFVHSLADSKTVGFKIFFCSNSFAAYRRSALLGVGGFPLNSIMGEDAVAAAKLLINGYKKAYVANAEVYHSHDYNYREEFQRYFDTRVFHEQNKWLIDQFGKPTGEGFKFIKSELSYALKNNPAAIPGSLGSTLAKWAGYRIGKYYKKMPLSYLEKISMHRYYWQKST